MTAHNALGRWGEDKVAEYLQSKGWYIRHRDWRYNHTDIDLVCIDEDDTMLLFVEVKTRSTNAYGRPSEAVDADKRRNIVTAASAYKRMCRKENRHVRYDIISIVVGDAGADNFTLEHIEDAFSLMDVYEDRYR